LAHHVADWYVSIHADDEASNGTKGPGGDGESANDVAGRFMAVIKVRCRARDDSLADHAMRQNC